MTINFGICTVRMGGWAFAVNRAANRLFGAKKQNKQFAFSVWSQTSKNCGFFPIFFPVVVSLSVCENRKLIRNPETAHDRSLRF